MTNLVYEDYTISTHQDPTGFVATIYGLCAEGISPSGFSLDVSHPNEASARIAAETFINSKLAELLKKQSNEYNDSMGEIN